MAIANLIVKIAADISELKTGSDKALATLEKTGSKIDSIGAGIKSTLLAAFSVGAVVSFGKSVLAAASQVHDMALRLGISAEAAQRFKFAAEQSGSTIEDVGRAINTLNRELAGGDKGTVQALRDAGLSFQQIRAMSPEQAFLAVTEAIRNIKDPMVQAEVGTKLLGKAWLALAPAIKEGITELGRGATVMSNETTKSLADAEDAWVAFADKITIVSGTFLAHSMRITQSLTSSWGRFAGFLEDSVKFGAGAALAMADASASAKTAGKDINLSLTPAFHKTQEELDRVEAAQKKAAAAATAHAKAIQSLRDELSGRGAIKAANDMVEALRKLPPVQTMTIEAQKKVNTVMGAAREAYRAMGSAVNSVDAQKIKDLHLATLAMTLDAIPLTHKYGKALEEAGFKIIPLINNQERLAKLGGGAWPQMIHDANQYIPIVGKAIDASKTLGDTIQSSMIDVLGKMPDVIAQAFTGGGGLLGALKAVGVMLADAVMTPLIVGFSKLQKSAIAAGSGIATALGGAAGGGMGATIAGIAGGLGGAALAASSWGTAMAGAGIAGTVALGAATLGIGAAAVGVAILVKRLTDSKGRDAVKKFAESFGGFDPLHKKLSEIGASGEALWVKLTQGVGSNNPKQAQAVIEEITAALNKQGAQTQALSGIMEEYGFTWEDLGEKARGAKLSEMFDTLFEKTQILKDAGIDYSEILKRQSTDYSLLVQAAVRTGSEIPIAMQPILQELIEMGTLVDANGDAFSSLGDLTFAKTLTQGFDQVTLAIHELTDALTNGVGGALNDLGRKVIHVPIKFDVDDIPGGAEVPGFAGGTHGRLLNFGPRGSLVMLHGKEGVVTERDVKEGLDLGTGTASQGDTYVYVGNEALDPRMVKIARQDAARGGLKTRAGSGRSY